MIKAYLGDAMVWMRLAGGLADHVLPSGRPKCFDMYGYPAMNEINVSTVCAGYAFELVFKALLRAEDLEPQTTHPPSDAYDSLSESIQRQVGAIARRHGWATAEELLEFLDTKLCVPSRKYWMRSRNGGPAKGNFYPGGKMSIQAMSHVHSDLCELALDHISMRPVFEDWPGLAKKKTPRI